MSEDSSSSDAYFEMFVSEYDRAGIPQYDKKVDLSVKLNTYQDLSNINLTGNKNSEIEIQALQGNKDSSSYEFVSLFNRQLSKSENSIHNFPCTSGNSINNISKTNIILSKTIPWLITPKKSVDQNNLNKNANLLYAIKTEFLLCSISINHDGSIFAFSDGSQVYFVSLQDGSNIYSVCLPPDNREIQTRALCFSKDSKYLAASICKGKIAIISDKSVQAVLSKHTNIVSSLAFTDEYLISGGFDGSLILWKINSKNDNDFAQTPKSNNYAHGQMSSSSSTSSSNSNSPFSLYKEIQYQSVISIDCCQTNSFVAIGFANSTVGIFDSKYIIGDAEKDFENEKDDFSSSSSNSANQDNEARVNSTHSLDALDTIISHYSESSLSSPDSSDTPSIDTSHKGTYISKSGVNSNPTENTIHSKMKNSDTKIKTFKVHQNSMLNVIFSPKNNLIATCSKDKTAKIWRISELLNNNVDNNIEDNSNIDSQNMIHTSPPQLQTTLEDHSDFVTASAFSPIDDIIFTGSKDETIKAWNILNGELLFTLNAHQNTVFAIKHHPSKRIFVSCSGDGLICVWNYMSTD